MVYSSAETPKAYDNRAPIPWAKPVLWASVGRAVEPMGRSAEMKEVQVERLFVTSLQKAVEEHAPEELEVLSQWFDPSARQTRFHVATVIGAVGYLRRNPTLYAKVIDAAGRNASERAYDDFSPIERRLLGSLPRFGRERLVKHLLHSGLRSIHKDAQLAVKRDGEKLLLSLGNSLFCHTPGGGWRPEALPLLCRPLCGATRENGHPLLLGHRSELPGPGRRRVSLRSASEALPSRPKLRHLTRLLSSRAFGKLLPARYP